MNAMTGLERAREYVKWKKRRQWVGIRAIHIFRGKVVLTKNQICEVVTGISNRNRVGVKVTGIKEFKEL